MQIRIRHYVFNLSEPYQPGTVLTAGEAQALNGLRAENIRNNVARAILDEVAALASGEMLPPETLQALQLVIDQYAAGYQFILRHEPRTRPGLIDREARELATDRVIEERRRTGEPTEGASVEAEIELLTRTSTIQDLARRRIAQRQAIAASAMEELL